MGTYLRKPSNNSNFVAGAVIRAGATPDDPVVIDGTEVSPDIATVTGAGAVPITSATVEIVTTGANALTLADGADGQKISIVMITDGGDGTLTPSNFGNGSTITFGDVGDSVTLVFTNAKWYLLSNVGCAIA